MFRCDRCGKEDFKSESGLKRHMNGCAVEEPATVVEDVKVVELDDSIVRKIKKLRDARNSCYDAETRYKLECEIRELEGN